MTLNIELPDEKAAALAAKACTQGLSAEQYARQVIEQDLEPGAGLRPNDATEVEYHRWPLGVKTEITRKEIYDRL